MHHPILTTLRINLDHPAARAERLQPGPGRRPSPYPDVCKVHNRVVSAVAGLPENPDCRLLWAQPEPDLLIIRAFGPVTAASFPAGYATVLSHRTWTPPPDGRVVGAVTFSPQTVRHPRRADRITRDTEVTVIRDPDAQVEFMRSRLAVALDVTSLDVQWRRVRVGAHRTGRTVTSTQVGVVVTGTVTDHDVLVDKARRGWHKDKAWGCGLSVWKAA